VGCTRGGRSTALRLDSWLTGKMDGGQKEGERGGEVLKGCRCLGRKGECWEKGKHTVVNSFVKGTPNEFFGGGGLHKGL